MKLVVLGSGTYTTIDRESPGYILDLGGPWLLIEASENIFRRVARAGYNPAEIRYILVSHPHPDHLVPQSLYQSIYGARAACGIVAENKITVFGGEKIERAFEAALQLQLNGSITKRLKWPQLEFIFPWGNKVGTEAKIYGFPVRHDCKSGELDALAFRIEMPDIKFCYSGDTGWCDGILRAAEACDVFLCECSRGTRPDGSDEESGDEYGHLTAYQAGLLARQSGTRVLILTHYFSSEGLYEDCVRSGFEGQILLAEDMRTYDL